MQFTLIAASFHTHADWPAILKGLPPDWADLLRALPPGQMGQLLGSPGQAGQLLGSSGEMEELLASLPPDRLQACRQLPSDWKDRMHIEQVWVV